MRRPSAGRLGLLCSLLCASIPTSAATFAAELEPAPADLDARAIALRAEDTMRSQSSFLEATMTVESPRLSTPRVVAFRSYDDRARKRSFIRILSPAKDAGTGFLKIHPNLWMFVPRVERTLRIPPSMMLQPWMGSDFTNDDLVNESSDIDDYDHKLLGIDPRPEGHEALPAYVVEYTPHEDTPVVWGKIVSWIEIEFGTPLLQEFYDEDGEKLRVMRFDDIREVQGRRVPHLWSMDPLAKPGHRTRIEIHEIRFDASFDEAIFTTRHLKKRE